MRDPMLTLAFDVEVGEWMSYYPSPKVTAKARENQHSQPSIFREGRIFSWKKDGKEAWFTHLEMDLNVT